MRSGGKVVGLCVCVCVSMTILALQATGRLMSDTYCGPERQLCIINLDISHYQNFDFSHYQFST